MKGYARLQIAYIAYNFITMKNLNRTKIPLTPESEVGYTGSEKASSASRQRQALRKVGTQSHGSKAGNGYDRRVAEMRKGLGACSLMQPGEEQVFIR